MPLHVLNGIRHPESVPCETCGDPTPYTATKRCDNCWEVERRLDQYLKSPKAFGNIRRAVLPDLDSDFNADAILRDHEVKVVYDDLLIDGNGNTYPAGNLAGWSLSWKHGCIFIGPCSERIARKAAALFVSLWLRGVSAALADLLMGHYAYHEWLAEPHEPGTCQRCRSKRLLSFSGKTADCFQAELGDKQHFGYPLRGVNLGGGDYVKGIVCLDCGQHQGKWPVAPCFMECDEESAAVV